MRRWWRDLRAAVADLVWVQRLELRTARGLPPAEVYEEVAVREARLRLRELAEREARLAERPRRL